MAEVYNVQRGDSPWSFARKMLERQHTNVTNQQIAAELKKLPSLYGCKNIDEFAKKFFIAGKSFEINSSHAQDLSTNSSKDSVFAKRDSIEREIFSDSSKALKTDAISDTNRARLRVDSSFRDSVVKTNSHNNDSVSFKKALGAKNWKDIEKLQNKINKLPTDKQRIIEYNRTIGNIKDNYVIVDKKNYSATVYSPDGKVIKQYEIGVAKNEGDQLLRRSKKNAEKNIASTSAGIYTANYRATGRDAYKRLYNDRVLTLSNDGLKDKGVGNGETGVAFHQVPNGNTARRNKLLARGTSKENNRFSSGCINFLPQDFDDCMKQIKGVGTKVYILPEDKNNFMSVKNGKLQFSQKKYTGNVATTSTKNNPVKSVSIKTKKSDMRKEATKMANTLSKSKKVLTKVLGLDNDTYNHLAMLTLGIAGQETRYGDPTAGTKDGKPYWAKENCSWLVNFTKNLKGNNSYNSRGITQMKIKSYTDPEVQKLFKKYGINENNLNRPDKAAVATMIVLSSIYKNELPALKTKIEKLNISKDDAVLYCWNGRKSQITGLTATPKQSIYHKNVYKFMNDFTMTQYAA